MCPHHKENYMQKQELQHPYQHFNNKHVYFHLDPQNDHGLQNTQSDPHDHQEDVHGASNKSLSCDKVYGNNHKTTCIDQKCQTQEELACSPLLVELKLKRISEWKHERA